PLCRLLFFVFMLNLRLPRSSLFPYTTLFRSHRQDDGDHVTCGPRCPFDGCLLQRGGFQRDAVDQKIRIERIQPMCNHQKGIEDRDRKSTRLNSSHVENSYAVFCLKKKKKKIT